MFLKGKTQEFIHKVSAMNAFDRLAKPKDIARIVQFLASDESKWISGQVIGENGAMV